MNGEPSSAPEARTEDDRLDDTPLRFGKYKGQTPNQIAEHDPSYVTWMRANVLPPVCSRELAIACEQDEREDEAGWLYEEDMRDD